MVWDQLSINKPHLVYIILGGFTSMFMLVSLFIKEKMYIGEATVATICGLIFGPHAANLINPLTWGNTDQITLEFSRIVLVVQCFAVGVELPKAYMERHWLSVVLLLVPVMTFGWLIVSLFIWWMIIPLTWLESLCVAACVTATDPVLASSVVGKGKFAKRVPKHIRDLLSAESGCNDGMAFPFIYLSLNLIHYHLDAKHVIQHWFCNTILYECIWGAVYGVLIGYIARQAIKWAENKGIIDRESFLVFYFVLALFCAGSGSLLGMDDLLVGFAAGVGFSNDGWFLEKTEESHVSNVIDLLLNLTYFVYLGTIIPWDQFNSGLHGLEAWRLVVIAIMVLFFRRIPIMLMLKPIIPDIKTWREAMFCGHFGPIGVGAIFVAILARAELETGSTTPLAVLPDPSDVEYVLIYTIWPIVTFMVITSIVVHGSSIAVFTLGKRINTLTMTLSYTTGNDQSSSWMNRLPRVSSTSKSMGKSFTSDMSEDEKADFPPGELPPIGIPKLHLRRQKEDEYENPPQRASIRSRGKKKKKSSLGAGGPISDSAITPQRTASNSEPNLAQQESGSDTLVNEKSERPSPDRVMSDPSLDNRAEGSSADEGLVIKRLRPSRSLAPDEVRKTEVEAYEEKDHLIIEDQEGNVVKTVESRGKSQEEKLAIVEEARDKVRNDKTGTYAKNKHEPHARNEGEELKQEAAHAAEHPDKHFRDHFRSWKGFGFGSHSEGDGHHAPKKPERKRGPAHAYQYGNTIIVEDEDGEVIHKYEIPGAEGEHKYNDYMKRMSTWVGLGGKNPAASQSVSSSKHPEKESGTSLVPPSTEKAGEGRPSTAEDKTKKRSEGGFLDDDGLRMVISNAEQYGLTGLRKNKPNERRPSMQQMTGGRRMSTQDFIRQMQQLDRESRQTAMDEQGVHEEAQHHIHRTAEHERPANKRGATNPLQKFVSPVEEEPDNYFSSQSSAKKPTDTNLRVPRPEAQRSHSAKSNVTEEGDEADVPSHDLRSTIARHGKGSMTSAEARRQQHQSASQSNTRIDEDEEEDDPNEETAAEKRRRLAALGLGGDSDSSDDEETRERRAIQEPSADTEKSSPTAERRPLETRPPPREREVMAEPPRMRVQWGSDTIGAVRGKGSDDAEGQQGSGSGQRDSAGSFGKKFKGLLNK